MFHRLNSATNYSSNPKPLTLNPKPQTLTLTGLPLMFHRLNSATDYSRTQELPQVIAPQVYEP